MSVTSSFFNTSSGTAGELGALVETVTPPETLPMAAHIEREVAIYDAATFALATHDPSARERLLSELAYVLLDGAGVFIVKGAVAVSVVEAVTVEFEAIIAEQNAGGAAAGDHFAPAGANDRVWNALEKLAVRAPELFVDYYNNDAVALASTAWLGPGYQVTSQLNVINPGGAAQTPHRDYHLGFMNADQAIPFPSHVHTMSPLLTLQGAIAHCAMPVETGPTLLLPHSQKLRAGYVSAHRADVRALFAERHVQLPLEVGDAMFFNPALMHAGGSNRTSNVRRMANLLQISSAFGRALEAVDRTRICRVLYPVFSDLVRSGRLVSDLESAIAASAEGYAFPTSLDRDPPIGGMAPLCQADFLRRALAEGWSAEVFNAELDALDQRRRSW